MADDDQGDLFKPRHGIRTSIGGSARAKKPRATWSPPKRSSPPIIPTLPRPADGEPGIPWRPWKSGMHPAAAKPPCACGKDAGSWSRCVCGIMFASCGDCAHVKGKSMIDVVRDDREKHLREVPHADDNRYGAGKPA